MHFFVFILFVLVPLFFPVDLCPLPNWGIFQTLILQIFVLAPTSLLFPSGDFSDTNDRSFALHCWRSLAILNLFFLCCPDWVNSIDLYVHWFFSPLLSPFCYWVHPGSFSISFTLFLVLKFLFDFFFFF